MTRLVLPFVYFLGISSQPDTTNKPAGYIGPKWVCNVRPLLYPPELTKVPSQSRSRGVTKW